MKITVIYHRADFDGIFCREIAKKFLPEAELIGWHYGDKKIPFPDEGEVYVLDLSPECFTLTIDGLPMMDNAKGFAGTFNRLIWIDHHKSAIETFPAFIPGYRIDGVSACRLAWQWFTEMENRRDINVPMPSKIDFVDRTVSEPLAVRLAGEYDIWDKRDPDADLFQHGLRSKEITDLDWKILLMTYRNTQAEFDLVKNLLNSGEAIQYVQTEQNKDIITSYGFDLDFEGLKFLACNHARYNSHLFTSGLKPEHDGCFGFKWTGKFWEISLYHAPGKEHHDLSLIAKKYGGGGHRGACGFRFELADMISHKIFK